MDMPVDKIIERLGFMEKHFADSPAPEFAETCHYAVEALKAAAAHPATNGSPKLPEQNIIEPATSGEPATDKDNSQVAGA